MDTIQVLTLDHIFSWLLITAAYLIGSISSAVITCKLLGLPDPRTTGSKNPGATNVLRSGGKKAAIITLLGDMIKGVIPVLVAHALNAADPVLILTGLAAFLGHLYPVFLKFKGGKGVATALGVFVAIDWQVGLCVMATWLAVAIILRISSLSALVAALAAPAYMWHFTDSDYLTYGTIIMTVLLYWRHRSNIKNLLSGLEEKIGEKKGED